MTKDGEHTLGRPCEHCSRPAVVSVGGVWLCQDHFGVKSAEEDRRQFKDAYEQLVNLHRKQSNP